MSQAKTKRSTRIAVVGSGGVGKSAITVQYIQNIFLTDYDPTIEDSYSRQTVIDGYPWHLDILDTAGQEEYSALRDSYMRAAQGFLLVYNITEDSTFQEIAKFRDIIVRAKDKEDVPMVIVGNKCDLEDQRQVKPEEGKKLADQYKCPFLEVSAKIRKNIDESFELLVREVAKREYPAGSEKKEKKGGGGCLVL